MIRERLQKNPIMAAAQYCDLEIAAQSNVEIIVLMNAKLHELMEGKLRALNTIKPVYIHMDLVSGLASDEEALLYIKNHVGITGIVSTKNRTIQKAKKLGLQTIQRIFLIDTRSLDNAIASIKNNNPDAVEIMPGIAFSIVSRFREEADVPIILSGLISSEDLVQKALESGADGISMSCQSLWH